MERDEIGQRLARVTGDQAVDLFEVGIGDLGGIFADFDFGDDAALPVLHGGELVDPAEHRLGLGGDEALPDAEGVDLSALKEKKIPMMYSSRELEAKILHSVSPASSSICRALQER